ncbi:ATP-binding cassette domain-containing protein [Oscillatoria sp. FACHB-1406]|uniref:ATP-binding cassette domain-containing protein n=1 Tax=Oscillatoria sp. FACHB-1406 TaxID=2692846 RepID=UPI001685D0F1|nr:ABC transporter ATP-binding protein [Oscillatoria sp. FACHB-1406]
MAKVVLDKIYKSYPARRGEAPSSTADGSKSQANSTSVLRSINLTIEDGEFMVLVGPSGCGKSTLLRSIAGLEELTGGNIYVGDRLVNALPPKERNIAMVFQSYALYPHLTVYDNIAFGLRRMYGEENVANEEISADAKERAIAWGKKLWDDVKQGALRSLRVATDKETAIAQQVRSVAKLLQIEPLLRRYPKQLSGGQKQRVALGRAIARNPQVFLMDEPLSNLDAKLRAETRSQIVQLQRQLGTTTIYVTHDQTEAMTMGDRIAVMNQGEIQQVAKPLELYNRPANRFVAEFIGSPPMNFLPVQVKAPLLLVHPQFRLTVPALWFDYLEPYDGRSLLLGLRPEHLALSPAAPKNICAIVDRIEALGNDTYVAAHLVEDRTCPLQVRLPPDAEVKMGETIWFSVNLDKIHLFEPQSGQAIWQRTAING